MKQEFAAKVRELGGSTAYSGRTEQAIMTEKTQQVHTTIHGRVPVLEYKYSGYRKRRVATGYYAGRKLVAMKGNQSNTMYVKGLDEARATQLALFFNNMKLPFVVVFQENIAAQ